MKIGFIRGVIARRLLVNYRVDPRVLASLLPDPFRPVLVGGFGMAGICLIRLRGMRPQFVPECFGLGSENAAHRVAVEWDESGTVRRGVFIPRRDTNSWLNVVLGGRLFPGRHHRGTFRVEESQERFTVEVCSQDGPMKVLIKAHKVAEIPSSSVFKSLDQASEFFQQGSVGFSPTAAGPLEGLELRCVRWSIEPLVVDQVEATFFDDRVLFPEGSIKFDSAFLMRGVAHEWHRKSQPLHCCGTSSWPNASELASSAASN